MGRTPRATAARARRGALSERGAPARRDPPAQPFFLACLLAGTFLIKLTVLVQLHDHPLLQPIGGLDTAVYVDLGRRVAGGDLLLSPGAYYVSPLYIYFVAACLAVSGGALVAVRVAQIVLGTVAVGLVHATAREWFGVRAAWMASALAALTGLLTFYEVVILQASIEPILTAFHLYALTRALRSGRTRWYLTAGAGVGLHALNRPNLLLWGLGLVLLLLLRHGRPRLEAGWTAAAVAAGLAAALAPVAARNLAVTGALSVLPSHGGLNLYVGNNPRADGTYHTVPGITPDIDGQAEDARRVAETALQRPLSDAEVSGYFTSRALEWIRSTPGRATALFLRKLYYVFQRATIPLNYSYAYYTREVRSLLRALVVGPWLLVPLGLLGLAFGAGIIRATRAPSAAGPRGGSRPPAESWVSTAEGRSGFRLWAAFVPVYAVGVAIFFVATRYRLPLMVPLAVGSGATIDALLTWRRATPDWRTAAATGLALVALGAAVNWPLGLDDGRGNERTWMTITLITQGRYEEARALADSTQPIHPYPGVMRFRLGQAYRRVDRPDLAIAEYEASLAVDPRQPETELALGQTLADSQRWADAIPHLRVAFEAGYRRDLSGFDLARSLAESGDSAGAIAVLSSLTDDVSRDASSLLAIGDLALGQDALALADRFYRAAVAREPGRALAREKLGIVLSMMDRSDEAIRELEEACRLDPASPSARLNLAVALARAGRLDAARAQARESLRIDPTYARARAFLDAISR